MRPLGVKKNTWIQYFASLTDLNRIGANSFKNVLILVNFLKVLEFRTTIDHGAEKFLCKKTNLEKKLTSSFGWHIPHLMCRFTLICSSLYRILDFKNFNYQCNLFFGILAF